jgi:PAS domain S-box-containing protein
VSDSSTGELAHAWSTLHESAREGEAIQDASELDGFFTVTPDMVCLADTKGHFTRVNPAWTEALGWTPAELVGRAYLDFVHPDDRDATTRVAGKLATGEPVIRFENRYAAADGSYHWLSWRARLDPRTGLIAAIARDVTARKQAEQQLEALNQKLEQATKAKNVFLSRMSHDLRTPLNAILGFAQLLDMDDLSPEQHASIRHILSGGRHLLDLINEVLDIARIEAGQLSLSVEPVKIADAVHQAVDLVRPLADERGITLDVDNAPTLFVYADRQRLTQVLLNLLSNAVKYNRDNGRITIAILGDRSSSTVGVVVRDTGAGIAPDKMALLFTPFERLGAEQSAIEGTGLGLSLAKSMTELMGGSITVDSVVDKGTAFRVDLKRCDELDERHQVGGAATAALNDSQGTLLYVEDNVSNVWLMERLMAHRPRVRLVHAGTGRAALAMIRSQRPHMILLDLHLPDMDGEEVLRQLWNQPETRGIPVVILTADATNTRRSWLMASGAVAYLTKPFDVADVLRVIDQYLHPSPATTRP